MEEYVNELEIVLQKLQSLKIEGTYGNVLIMKECIERILNLGKTLGGQVSSSAPMLQMMPQKMPSSVREQASPEIVEVEEIGNSDV